MGHNLNVHNGKASMAYVGEVPWHRLGTKLDKPATAAEAIQAANLDYPVELRPLKAVMKGRSTLEVPNHFATVRTDESNAVLGIVGSRYEVIPNVAAFSFFDGLVDRDEAIYHSAGVLGAGERCWILSKLPGYIRVGKNDLLDKYVLLVNSHDGSSPTVAKLTSVRVVCQNTLTAALTGSEQSVSIRHTANAVQKLEEAHKILGLYNSLYSQLDFIFNRMALAKVTDKQLLDYVKKLVPDNEDAMKSSRTSNIRTAILDLHESGRGAQLARGTLWGALNAVAEYTDHVQGSQNPEKALKSIWFGSAERTKKQAFQLAQSML
jgi:phage/plasmid-like protein (TIGR03299 family)